MKKLLSLAAMSGFVCVGLLVGCKKQEPVTPAEVPSTNAPATPAPTEPSTNAPATAPEAPATNAPAQ